MTDPKKPLSPEEQLRALELAAMGPDAREMAEIPIEDVDRALTKAGLDPAAVAKSGAALAAQLMTDAGILPASTPDSSHNPDASSPAPDPDPSSPVPNPDPSDASPASDPAPTSDPLPTSSVFAQPAYVPRARRASTYAWLLAAAFATAAGAAGVAVAIRQPPPPVPPPVPDDTTPPPRDLPPSELAIELRRGASDDCARGEWTACVQKLDHAERLDPAGEASLDVQRLRVMAASATATKPEDKGGK